MGVGQCLWVRLSGLSYLGLLVSCYCVASGESGTPCSSLTRSVQVFWLLISVSSSLVVLFIFEQFPSKPYRCYINCTHCQEISSWVLGRLG